MGEFRINFEVKGLGEVEAMLDRVERALTPPSFTESLGEGADVFVRGAQDRAPFDTGKLKNSIDKRPEGDTSWVVAPGEDLIPIYAAPQEFGAHAHGDGYMTFKYKGRWVRKKEIPAHPYMRPTFTEDSEAAARAVFEDIKRKITG